MSSSCLAAISIRVRRRKKAGPQPVVARRGRRGRNRTRGERINSALGVPAHEPYEEPRRLRATRRGCAPPTRTRETAARFTARRHAVFELSENTGRRFAPVTVHPRGIEPRPAGQEPAARPMSYERKSTNRAAVDPPSCGRTTAVVSLERLEIPPRRSKAGHATVTRQTRRVQRSRFDLDIDFEYTRPFTYLSVRYTLRPLRGPAWSRTS